MKGHTLQQPDSIISAKGQTAWSSVILGKVDDKLLTLQVTLPADNQQQAQTDGKRISYVDLRYDSGAAVGWVPAPVEETNQQQNQAQAEQQ